MKVIEIGVAQIGKLDIFLKNLGKSQESFRYFVKRPYTVIQNHLITLLLEDNDETPCAYGHIDHENGVYWLGIAVAEKYTGKGYGKLMLQSLIEKAQSKGVRSIRLSVDVNNYVAQKLYKQFHFRLLEEKETYKLFQLDIK